MVESRLTTVDNPWDPFEHYDEWYAWDTRNGYNTASYLARMVVTSYDMSDADQTLAINYAIDEIVQENINGMYRKVTKDI